MTRETHNKQEKKKISDFLKCVKLQILVTCLYAYQEGREPSVMSTSTSMFVSYLPDLF